MRGRLGVAIVLALSLAAGRAEADRASRASARQAFDAAQAAYAAGEYAAAVTGYKAAYEIDPDPVYLFDTAQALRLSDQCAEAANYYHRFLVAVPHPPNLDKITALVDDVEKCAATAAAIAPTPGPAEPIAHPRRHRRAAPDGDGDGALGTDRQVGTDIAANPDAPGRHPLRPLGIAAAALGVVSLGAGIYFTSRVSHFSADRAALCPTGCTWTSDLAARAASDDSSGHRDAGLAIAGYALGAAAVTTGVLLYLHVERPPVVGVGFVPGGATLSAHVSF